MALDLMNSTYAERERNRAALEAELNSQNAQARRMRFLGKVFMLCLLAGVGVGVKVYVLDGPSLLAPAKTAAKPKAKKGSAPHKFDDPDALVAEAETGQPMQASVVNVPHAEAMRAIGGAAAARSKAGQELAQITKEMEKSRPLDPSVLMGEEPAPGEPNTAGGSVPAPVEDFAPPGGASPPSGAERFAEVPSASDSAASASTAMGETESNKRQDVEVSAASAKQEQGLRSSATAQNAAPATLSASATGAQEKLAAPLSISNGNRAPAALPQDKFRPASAREMALVTLYPKLGMEAEPKLEKYERVYALPFSYLADKAQFDDLK